MQTTESPQIREVYELDRAAAVEAFDRVEFSKTFTHHTEPVKDANIHYVIGGQGEPLLLLHGELASWYAFRKILPLLAKHFTVIAADLPGMGDSTAPSAYDKKTIGTYIHQFIEQLGYKNVFLLGHDLGGHVAFATAGGRPDMISKLVLLEAVLAGTELNQLQENAFPNVWHVPFNAMPGLAETFIKGRERLYISHFFMPWSFNLDAINEATIDEYERIYSMPGKITTSCSYYRSFLQDVEYYKTFSNRKLPMPILFLAGDKSMGRETTEDNLPYRSIAKFAQDSRYEVVKNCGHHVAEERPIYLAQRLTTFFKQE